jgi:hypothetical protein
MARPEGEQPEIERTAQQKKPDEKAPTLKARLDATDFSVVLFRPNFMLASEQHPMKVHINQRFLTLPLHPELPCGATNQDTPYGFWGADTFAVT